MPDTRVLARLTAGRAATAPAPDADLLARFLLARDAEAFAEIVRRHGRLVRAVCWRHLHQAADVDDAFQATFLVLARRADAVRNHAALGGWLHRVAERVCGKLRRGVRPAGPLPDELAANAPDPAASDTRRAVREAVGRLPADYRAAVELCYVAGYTTAEAADRLGWPKGTVLTRLAWARKRLRADLLHRGFVPAAGAVGGLLLDRTACAVGPGAVQAASRAAATVVMQGTLAGVASERAVHLTQGVLRTMTLTKLSWVAGVAAVAAALTGAGVTTWAGAQTPTRTTQRTKQSPSLPPATPRPAEPLAPPAADLTTPTEIPSPALPPMAEPPRSATPAMIPPQSPPAARSPRTYTLTTPSGTWTREFAEGTKLAVRFDDDRLVIEATFAQPGRTTLPNTPSPQSQPTLAPASPVVQPAGTLLIDADYAMNKEGVVFGVITGIEHDLPANTLAGIDRFVGQPFAFRLRQDDQAMSAKDLKLGGAVPGQTDAATQTLSALLVGRYYPAGKDVAGPGVRKQLAKPRLAIGQHGGMMPSLTIPRTMDHAIPAGIPSAGPDVQEQPGIEQVPPTTLPGATPSLPPQPAPTRPSPKRPAGGGPSAPDETGSN